MTNPGLCWQPRGGIDAARRRAKMLRHTRRYFAAEKVLEIDAPAVTRAAVTDPNIDSLAVAPAKPGDSSRYLHSSPEFAMKRLLAAGFPDIYFVGKVYRDGEAGRRHQPEFTMVEWYRLGFGLDDIIDDCERLLSRLLGDERLPGSSVRQSYSETFEHHLGVDPLCADIGSLAKLAGADESLRQSLGDDRDAWLDLLLATKVAPMFPADRLVTLYHYPASQAALSRLEPAQPQLAQRFEVFVGELELANGYVELADAAEQRRRIDGDRRRRKETGKPAHAADERFLAALEAGLPDCAGVAVGLDRLLMLAMNADDIRDVRHFCWETA